MVPPSGYQHPYPCLYHMVTLSSDLTIFPMIYGSSPASLRDLDCLFGVLCRYDNAHSHSHVKGVEHIVFRHIAGLCDQVEDRQDFDRSFFYGSAQSVRYAPRNVLIEAAAGYVGNAFYLNLFEQGQHWLYIYLRRSQQGFAQGTASQLLHR